MFNKNIISNKLDLNWSTLFSYKDPKMFSKDVQSKHWNIIGDT